VGEKEDHPNRDGHRDQHADDRAPGSPGKCLSVAETGSLPWQATIASCTSSLALLLAGNGSILTSSIGFCLDGAQVADCGYPSDQPWIFGPSGQLIDASTGLCLDDPQPSATVVNATMAPCFGEPGEIWGIA
jgi:hypothetical protein